MMRRKNVRGSRSRKTALSNKRRPQVRRATNALVEHLEERALMAVVGYYDASTASLSTAPDLDMSDVIIAAGHTPVRLTDANIGTFNFGTLDVLMIGTRVPGSVDPSRPQALLNAYPAIQTWVNGGGRLIIHDANPSSNTNGSDITPGMDGVSFFGTGNGTVGLGVNVFDATSAIVDGPDMRDITNTNLDNNFNTTTAVANGYASALTLPAGVTTVLVQDSDPNRAVVMSYYFGTGFVIYSTIGADFFASRFNDLRSSFVGVNRIYVPNEIDAAMAAAPGNRASAGGPYTISEGQTLLLSATHPSDPDGTLFTYAWDLNNDGAADLLGAQAQAPWQMLQALGMDDGTAAYSISLTVTDTQGNASNVGAIVTVNDVAPTPVILAADGTTNVPTMMLEGGLLLDASFTDPGDDVITGYRWSVTKDGTAYSGAVGAPNLFDFNDEGTYVVTLTATDEDGASGSVSHTITVLNANPIADAGGDVSANEGNNVTLVGSATDPGAADHLSAYWEVRDAAGTLVSSMQSGDGMSVTFVPADNGIYYATLVVSDEDGGVSSATAMVTVHNVAPAAMIVGAPSSGVEGTAIAMSGATADAGSADTHTFDWSVTKNGEAYASASGQDFSFTPDDNGSYVVTLTVTDDDGGVGTATASISVGNVAPAGSINGAPASGFEGTAVSMSGSVMDAGAADTHTFAWSVTKNGSPFASGSGIDFSFTPDDNGIYDVTLVVTDDDGDSSSAASASMDIANVAPTAMLGNPGGGSGGSPVLVSGVPISISGSARNPGTAYTITYAWTVTRDGSPFASGSGDAINFRPDDEGTYVVSLTATDDDLGANTVDKSLTVIVLPVSVQAVVAPAAMNENETVVLTGSVSGGTNIGVYDVLIDWGDGTSTMLHTTDGTFAVPHRYLDDGNGAANAVTVTASDARGRTGSLATSVMVSNVLPAVQLTNLTPGAAHAVGAVVTLSGQFTDPGTLDVHRAEFVLTAADGATVIVVPATLNADGTVTANYTFSMAGVYNVALNVYDDDGVGRASTVNGQEAFLVVSDGSTAGYALGAGWYNSAAGSYTPNPSLSGTAFFTLVAQYRTGDPGPTGIVLLKFGDMFFRSKTCETFNVSGSKAQITGSGTINGTGDYRFRITVIDGKSSGSPDRIRFRIWNNTSGGVVYDSNIGADEGGTTPIVGGNVLVQG